MPKAANASGNRSRHLLRGQPLAIAEVQLAEPGIDLQSQARRIGARDRGAERRPSGEDQTRQARPKKPRRQSRCLPEPARDSSTSDTPRTCSRRATPSRRAGPGRGRSSPRPFSCMRREGGPSSHDARSRRRGARTRLSSARRPGARSMVTRMRTISAATSAGSLARAGRENRHPQRGLRVLGKSNGRPRMSARSWHQYSLRWRRR